MRSIFAGLAAVVLAVSTTAVMAQDVDLGPNVGKAKEARAKQQADAAKGQRRAVEAEAKLQAEAVALAPKVAAATQITCTPTETRNLLTVDKAIILETSCREGPGFQSASYADATNAMAFPCLQQAKLNYPLGTGCTLPGNTKEDVAKYIQPFVTKAGSGCVATNAHLFGETPALAAYEVACADGGGQILTVTLPRGEASKTTAAPCVAIATLLAGQECSLTTAESNWAPIKALATKNGQTCPVTGQRYVGGTTAGSAFYELGCQDGSSFMIQANAKGDFERVLTCVQAVGIGGGCKLSDSQAAVANANNNYSSIVKAAGFDCQVTKFRAFQPKAGSTVNEIIEVGCNNRPESAFALITSGKAEVMNCVRARVDGFACEYSKPEDAYKLLTESLRSAGRNTCDVSGARVMGSGRTASYVEVACSDGAPGFVLSYPTGSGKPSEAIACGLARSIGGGCQLPTNKLGSDS